VHLHFREEIPDVAALQAQGADLIVAADGVNSLVRRSHAEAFGATTDVRANRYIWLGTTRRFDAFTFIFVETPTGVYQVHAYRFNAHQSAFIVECDEASWRGAGFDQMNAAETIAVCEELFAPWLDGHRLEFNATPHRVRDPWGSFLRVSCERWRHGNVVLLGDSAHTAHFSIGSGTKLAMEDAIALVAAFRAHGTADVPGALAAYEAGRRLDVLKLQRAAQVSRRWFENSRRYLGQEPVPFTFNLMSRSKRITYDNLAHAIRLVEELTAGTAACGCRGEASARKAADPPADLHLHVGAAGAGEPIVVRRCQYSAVDGVPNDRVIVHPARAEVAPS
jgi:anthraniloyl-CoA monooxygenase